MTSVGGNVSLSNTGVTSFNLSPLSTSTGVLGNMPFTSLSTTVGSVYFGSPSAFYSVPGNTFTDASGGVGTWTNVVGVGGGRAMAYAFFPIEAYGTQIPTGAHVQVTMADNTWDKISAVFNPVTGLESAHDSPILSCGCTNYPNDAIGGLAGKYCVYVVINGNTAPTANNIFNIYLPYP